ncbi:MAG: DUF2029 domain-containing protein [Asgard group archaeon]|nr:DUF2029 domain-containing protein [Asgard group archaeon]
MVPISNEENQEFSRVTKISDPSRKISFLDFKNNLKQKDWGEIGFDIAIVLLLIGFGLFIRILLSYEARINPNWGLESSSIVWNYGLRFSPFDIPIRGFADFGYYYKTWITAWYDGSWYLYEWTEPYDVYDYYSYPPVFMYFLVLTWRPGMNQLWMAFPMIVADAACAGVVYLILKETIKTETSRIIAVVGGILMAIAPINVIYDGIYWLNPGPVTLLTIIAFYFAIKKKWWQAFFWLAIATMTKQNALFFTYPVFMVMLGQKIREKTIIEAVLESIMIALLFVGVALLLSIPYVFIDPFQYGRHMLFPGRKIQLITEAIDPASNDCVSFAISLKKLGLGGFLLKIAAFGNYSMLWMILSASIIAVGMFWRSYANKMDNIEFFEWIAVYTIFSHIFMPRGVYKFYTAYYVPMILVAMLGSITYFFSNKKTVGISLTAASALFLGFNIWLIAMDRWAITFYLFIVALVIGLMGFIRADIIYIKEKKTKSEQNISIEKKSKKISI